MTHGSFECKIYSCLDYFRERRSFKNMIGDLHLILIMGQGTKLVLARNAYEFKPMLKGSL